MRVIAAPDLFPRPNGYDAEPDRIARASAWRHEYQLWRMTSAAPVI